MKLIDLLVKELPRRGGWPEGVDTVRQNCKGKLFEINSDYCSGFKLEKCDDWITDVVTKRQYEAALAASKAVVGHDDWIQWAGGDCPVDSEAIVEVKCRWHNQHQYNNDRAGDFYWSHTGSNADIIAYRLQQPTKSEQVRADAWCSYAGITEKDYEADLNECIGQDVDIPEWNGEGLPPAGCECEARYRNANKWVFFRCVGVDSGVAFGWLGKEAATLGRGSYEFRPLRTEAERAREDAETAMRTCLAGTGAGITPLAAKGIYDAIAAGKIPGVKLEEK